MSPFDPVTSDPRPVSLRVLDNLLGGVLRLVAGGQSSGFDQHQEHLLDIADDLDLVDLHVGFNGPNTYELAPLGQALLQEMDPNPATPERIYLQDIDPQELVGIAPCNGFSDWQVMRQGPDGNAEPVGDEFGTIAYASVWDAVEVLRTGRVWKHDMGEEDTQDPESGPLEPGFASPDLACLVVHPDEHSADPWTDIAARETWLHQDEKTGAILATPVSDRPTELERTVAPYGWVYFETPCEVCGEPVKVPLVREQAATEEGDARLIAQFKDGLDEGELESLKHDACDDDADEGEQLQTSTVNKEGIARWRQEARDREANDYLQALRDGEIEPRPCMVTSVEPSRFTVVVRLRGFEEPEALATRVRQTLETHPTLSMRVDEVVASDPMWTPQSSKVEGMREGQDWAASAVQAAVNGEPWDTEGATPSLRGTLRTLPVLIARREAEALRPIALALGWTEKDEVSGADIQDRVEGWAQERTEAVTLLRDRDDSLTWVEYGQRAEDDAARATRFEGSDLICEVLRERNWRWSTLAKMSAPVMLAMDPGAFVAAFVAAFTNVGPERSTVYMLDSTRLDELALQPGDTLSVEKAATSPAPSMGSIPLVDILKASGLDLSPAGLQRELEEAKARPWIEAPWERSEMEDPADGEEAWHLPEGAEALIQVGAATIGKALSRQTWRLVLLSPLYTDPQHARNAGNRIAPRFLDACLSGGLTEVEPGVYGTVNGRLQVEQ